MKAYIVTLLNIPESVTMAQRCINTADLFDVQANIFPAVWKDDAMAEMKNEKLTLQKFDTTFSNINAVVGNFITQYRIWKTILESNKPGIVLEHDAVFTAPVPDLTNKGDIINLGKPSYGKYQTKNHEGVYPMFSKSGGYMPGCHCYYLTPCGAQQLITSAKSKGVAPCDIFINKTNFPNIKEIYPWVAEAKDEFTTIQKLKGCTAKHNYDKDYKIVS